MLQPDRAGIGDRVGGPGSAERWFAAGFADREPAVAAALLDALRDTNAECYALVCEALAVFDVVDRLPQITTPVLAIAGAQDIPTPPEGLAQIASGVKDGRLIVLDGVGHLAAAAPDRVADLIADQLGAKPNVITTTQAWRCAARCSATATSIAPSRHQRVHRRLPGTDHPVRMGLHLDATRTRPAQPVTDHAHRTGRPRTSRRVGDASAGGPPQRCDNDEIKELLRPYRDLLRCAGCQFRIPHRE